MEIHDIPRAIYLATCSNAFDAARPAWRVLDRATGGFKQRDMRFRSRTTCSPVLHVLGQLTQASAIRMRLSRSRVSVV
jgi:hypothetical protein